MSLIWLAPLAWFGAALLALPVLIHLLARQRSRRVLFPTLRFLPASQLTALRRRAVSDWPLLLVRLGIVLVAVAASAAPVVVSPARRDSWNARVARAIIVTSDEDGVATIADAEAKESFTSARFATQRLPDALRAAADWLARQPPAAREVVIVGDIRERAMSGRDLDVLAPEAGVRFLPAAGPEEATAVELDAVGDVNGVPGTRRMHVTAQPARTTVRYLAAQPSHTAGVRVIAAADQQAHADAVLRAVLRQGVVTGATRDRAVTISFDGAPRITPAGRATFGQEWMQRVLEENPEVRGEDSDGRLLVQAGMPVNDPRAPNVVAGVVASTFAIDLEAFEPRRTTPAVLAGWSRPTSGVPADVLPADEGDRRWLWGGALVLLAIEHGLRTRRRRA